MRYDHVLKNLGGGGRRGAEGGGGGGGGLRAKYLLLSCSICDSL